MSDKEFDVINAFKDKLKFKEAFKWKVADILKFLKGVVDKPADYGAPVDRKEDFKLLYERIDALKPKSLGNTTGWTAQKWREEKLKVQQILRTGNTLTPTKKIKWIANDNSQDFFVIFDLLGAFLSLMGPAPASATSKNFYLPLVVVYARWICELSQFHYWRPAIAQITWASKDEGKTWYFLLGASLGGVLRDNENNAWVDIVAKRRHAFFSGVLQPPYKDFGHSITLDEPHDNHAGANFGNCGETYPFFYALADRKFKSDNYGISIWVARTQVDLQKKQKTEYVGKEYWNGEAYRPPCRNCRQLQRWYKLPDYTLMFGVTSGI